MRDKIEAELMQPNVERDIQQSKDNVNFNDWLIQIEIYLLNKIKINQQLDQVLRFPNRNEINHT
jgi:hypothetical protein